MNGEHFEGDLDENDNFTGKYTIVYEFEIPDVKVYDASSEEMSGLANNPLLEIEDSFYYGEAEIYDLVNDMVVTDYVNRSFLNN